MSPSTSIALYHGYELTGSGSNEYTRCLAERLSDLGHRVVVICGEPDPRAHAFVRRAVAWDARGNGRELFVRDGGTVTLHQLPKTSVHPVYLTDKQRAGVVKAFVDLTDEELAEYHDTMVRVVAAVLRQERPDVVHANHLVYQPVVAALACRKVGIPYYVVPHGSAIEYTVRKDARFVAAARTGLDAAAGVVWISDEVRARVHALFPQAFSDTRLKANEHMVGIGTDTSLFRPIPPGERERARVTLASMQRAGGRTPQQRRSLVEAIARGDLEATRRDWEAYDHGVEDADLDDRLAEIPTAGDLVTFVGSLTWGKGVQTLIAAMPQLLAQRPNAHLMIVGSGTYREVLEALVAALDGGHRETFARLVEHGRSLDRGAGKGGLDDIAAYGSSAEGRRCLWSASGKLAQRVHFIGRLDHPRLRLVLPWAKIAAFSSIVKEASPLVFAEALAAGVLPAAADHSGFHDGLMQLRDALTPKLWRAMCLPAVTEHRVAGTASQLATLLARAPGDPSPEDLRGIALQRYDWTGVAQRLSTAATSIARAR